LLLCISVLFVVTNQFALTLADDRAWVDFWHMGVWVVCGVILHTILNYRLPQRDPYIFPAMFLLTGWGLNIIDRLQPGFADRQSYWLIISSIVFVAILFLPHHLLWIRRYRYTWLSFGLLLLVITVFLGVNPSGSEFNPPRLWLQVLGNVYYQPSELMKVILVAFLASYLADHWLSLRHDLILTGPFRMPALSFVVPMLLMWGLSVAMVIWQRDLGTATIFFVVFLLMTYLGSGKPQVLVAGGIMLLAAGVIGYFLFDVVALRIDIWINPWQDPEGRAFQIVQSLMAFSAGGIIGTGIGEGLPTFIPVVHTDFVFAAIAEEWGLIGIVGVLGTVMLIVQRGFRTSLQNHHRPFIALMAAGLSLVIAIQSLMITGGTLRLIPLTGVTLPFVSYGGSSLLTGYIIVGLLLVLSNHET
jgi:cell division protein FtsW (lipid II flippase)